MRAAGRRSPYRAGLAAALVMVTLAGAACDRSRPPAAAVPAAEPLPAWGKKELLAVGDPALKPMCVRVKQRYLWVDKVEVMPASVEAGSQMNHRFVYTFCPEGPVSQLKGTLTTKVIRNGRDLIVDQQPGYLLTPGQWAVDARIIIPKSADPGPYTLETSFVAGGAAFKRTTEFTVY